MIDEHYDEYKEEAAHERKCDICKEWMHEDEVKLVEYTEHAEDGAVIKSHKNYMCEPCEEGFFANNNKYEKA